MDGGEHDVDELEDVECDIWSFSARRVDGGVDVAVLRRPLRFGSRVLVVLLDPSLLNF